MKLLIQVVVGLINLLVFWGIRVGNDLYSVWGGVNTSGSVCSFAGVFQYAKKDAGAIFSVIQLAGKDCRAIFPVFQLAGEDCNAVSALFQVADEECGAFLAVFQSAGLRCKAAFPFIQLSQGDCEALMPVIQLAKKDCAAIFSALQVSRRQAFSLVLTLVQCGKKGADTFFTFFQWTEGTGKSTVGLVSVWGEKSEHKITLIASHQSEVRT